MTSELKTQLEIRPMESMDIGTVFDIDKSLTGEERAINLTNLVSEDLGGVLDLSFVAEVNNRVIGFILARHTSFGEPVVEAGLIQGLGVHPLHQGHDVGSKLFAALTKKAQSKGINTLRVMLNERDSRMKGFFEHLGFNRAQLTVYDKLL